ncbi:o-succinylbenzoate--CoA ligase [Aegicerativicinus sediminis]|uniref:o-succinylbenzoate--CoA ligase n=1 Tax=Aegicerativicinus sediminis TaxID=2893202 RepID=UPI001E58A5BC|nr:o-succinylbenzoate--CoA ligase [Aegicerativicinus sediminis]
MSLNTFDWFKKWNGYTPDKIAVKDIESGQSLTYREIHYAGSALAIHLKTKLNLKKGDRIGILSENNLAQVILFAAAQKAGFILVPINFRLAPKEVDFILSNAECSLVYFQNDSYDTNLLNTNNKFENIETLYDYLGSQLEFNQEVISENDPIFILYTSGTTGFPKGTIYTHKMLFWNSINTSLSLTITSETTTLNCMPLFHTGGWNVLLTPVLHHGGTIIMLKKFEPEKVLNCIYEGELSLFMGVPTMLKMIAELKQFGTTDLSCLKYIIVGGESMPINLIKMYHQKGVPIRQGYGMTEVGPNLTSLHQKDAIRKQGSIGRPNYYVRVKVVDDNGEEIGANEAGELLISGPMVSPGYWKNEEATTSSMDGEWFRTGDVAKMDEEGYLFIVDRKKNMFISGGENVYPVEIERVLRGHPKVIEAVVIGTPHEKWGECGVAFLKLSSDLEPEEMNEYCKTRLAKFKTPSKFLSIDDIPKSDTGKIDRKKLKDDYLNLKTSV